MTKLLLISIVLFSFIFPVFVFSQTPHLTITEVFPDPKAVGDNDGEWFEVYNPSDQPVSIKGMKIRDEGRDSHTIDADLQISPKSYSVFCKNKNTEQNGGVNCFYQYSKFSLSNDSDEIILEKDGEIARLVYSKSTHPLKPGRSMELDGSTWHEATSQFGKGDYGTPGSGNSAAPTATTVPQQTATSVPKPTNTPIPTIQPTEVEEDKADVLAAEDIDTPEIQPTEQLARNSELPSPAVQSSETSSPEATQSGGIETFLTWGGVLSLMGAIGSFLWISNKGSNLII